MGQTLLTTQLPSLTNQNDGTDYTLATLFSADVDGTVNGVRWYSALQGEAGRIGLLWRYDTETSGTLLAQVNFVTTVDGGWNYTAFASPVAVVAGQKYLTAIYIPRWYTALAGGLASPIVNGDLTAPADNAGLPQRNGRFNNAGSGAPAYPSSGFGGNLYMVDTDFTANSTQPGRWGVHI